MLDDHFVVGYPGGAQYNIEFLMSKLTEKGYEVEQATPKSINEVLTGKWDLVILNCIWEFKPSDLKYIIDNFPIIRIEQDFHWCKKRDGSSKFDPNDLDERQQINIQIYENALFIAFYCVAQQEHTIRAVGDCAKNSYVFTAFMDPSPFTDYGKFRLPDSVLLTGRYYPQQGFQHILQFASLNPHMKVFTAGFGPMAGHFMNISNIQDLGKIPYTAMPDLYNMFHTFLFNPAWPGYPRTVMEAELCGMNVVTGPKAGPKLWTNAEELRDLLANAPKVFIEKMESVL